jgi:6-phosphogluconolactonase
VTTVSLRVEIEDDPEGVARRGAAEIADAARTAVDAGGSFALAVSGGTTPWAMFRALSHHDVLWEAVGIWQVDERIAPRGHEDRGLTHLEASLPAAALPRVYPMPVDDLDPRDDEACDEAAAAYAAGLPATFDLVHLGLGDDGHTASLAPDDPVLESRDRDVAITRVYRGRRRMTLTYPVLDRARRILWVAAGSSKADPLRKLIARDPSIPASHVAAPDQLAIVDRAAGSA